MAARVLIVGASLAGLSVAEALREQDHQCEIILVGDETSPPYDRPPLSKQVLAGGDFGPQDCLLRPAVWYSEHRVQLRTGLAAVSLDAGARVVTFADGTSQEADHVVIATGARPRELPGWAPSDQIRYLRTLRDGTRLRADLGNDTGHLCVVGAGFIGLEVASAAAEAGWSVTVLEAGGSPMSRILPEQVARLCVQPVLDLGVQIRYDETALGQVQSGSATKAVRLTGGSTVRADLVVVGVGALPNTEWLSGSGLEIDNGVVCSSSGQTNHQGVWAVGDAARWLNPITGLSHRVEHWQAAREQGQVVAQRLAGTAAEWASPPYFWSDLARAKVQFLGASSPEWRTHIVREGRRTLCLIGDERLRGILTVAHPRKLALGRALVMAKASFKDGLRWAAA